MKVKDFVFCLSLANLCFFKVYAELFSICSIPSNHYYVRALPSRIDYLAFILNVLLLASFLWACIWVAQRLKYSLLSKFGRLGFALLLTIPIFWFSWELGRIPHWILGEIGRWGNFLSHVFPPVVLWGLAGLGLVSIVAVSILFIRWGHWVFQAAVMTVLILSPFTALTLSRATIHLFDDPHAIQLADTPHSPVSGKNRVATAQVCVLLFDELDYRLAFPERPASIFLPELDSFRRQAIFALNAYPPANETMVSIPALVTGKRISGVEPVNADELMIKIDGQKTSIPWSRLPNIFSESRSLGFDSGLVGWTHPYGRVLGTNLEECSWYELANISNSTGDNLGSKIVNQFRTLLETPTFSVFGQSLTVKKSIATYQNLLRDAFGILGRDDLAIIFIHFSIPHPPYIYDLGKSDFSLANNRYSGYTGNLVLVDRTLGEIRHYMEKNGTWDKSHIIITSDHWWRKSTKFDGKGDHRVPFLVKLAGQEETINYQPAFNTLIIHDLILALLRGKIAQPKRVVEWIHKNGKPFIPVEVPGFD